MANSNDGSKDSTGIDRRAVIRGALVVGGVSALAGAAAAVPASASTATAPPQTIITEKEWARALARVIIDQFPVALAQVRDVQLTSDQILEIQKAYENTLVNTMGCSVP